MGWEIAGRWITGWRACDFPSWGTRLIFGRTVTKAMAGRRFGVERVGEWGLRAVMRMNGTAYVRFY